MTIFLIIFSIWPGIGCKKKNSDPWLQAKEVMAPEIQWHKMINLQTQKEILINQADKKHLAKYLAEELLPAKTPIASKADLELTGSRLIDQKDQLANTETTQVLFFLKEQTLWMVSSSFNGRQHKPLKNGYYKIPQKLANFLRFL